jgi:hypothetical protein
MSYSEASRGVLRLIAAASIGLAGAQWAACSRKADIVDEPAGTVTATPTGAPLDAGLTVIDGAFSDPSQPACDTRPEDQDCRSSNDFPCNFDALVESVAKDCKVASGCTSNGWFAAELGQDGCATRLEMSEPNDKFIECAIQLMSTVRCPCEKSRSQVYLGLGNKGCPDGGPRPCTSGELQCDPGEVCVEGLCLRVPVDGGT